MGRPLRTATTTRSTVNRILREAESAGSLRVERARLEVLDEAQLARRAG